MATATKKKPSRRLNRLVTPTPRYKGETLEIMQALVCATAHVTDEEALMLDARIFPDDRGYPWTRHCSDIFIREYGWLFYVGDASEPHIEVDHLSAGLRGVVQLAWRLGLKWVHMDRDAEALPGVELYN